MSNGVERCLSLLTKKEFDIEGRKIHFVGAGGVGMCSLIRLARSFGAKVSGSDRELGEMLSMLAEEGVNIYVGHKEEYAAGAELVVRSLAVGDDVPEIAYAHRCGIPCITRAAFLGLLNIFYKCRIAIAGTHGKSTTVAMLERMLSSAGRAPTVLSGAKLSCGTPTIIGGDDVMLYEACEYKDAFLDTNPTVTLITNIEMDHPDYFKDIAQLRSSFLKFANSSTELAVINLDDRESAGLINRITAPLVTVGSCDGAIYRYSIRGFVDGGYRFEVVYKGASLGIFDLPMIGAFNVTNAACAIAAAHSLGIEPRIIKASLTDFRGIARRLELIGEYRGRTIYYDYAHHPTEIQRSITALKESLRVPITVVFKPHTFSRTAALWDEFVSALVLADYTVLCDIYPAREEPISGISSQRLAEAIGDKAVYSEDSEVVEKLSRTDGAIVLMGAGDMKDVIKGIGLIHNG